MWWWTYVYHIKGCGSEERKELGLQLESSASLPLSFKWSDPTPVISDDFARWRDSIINSLASDQILEVIGIAYRDEVLPPKNVADLSTQRAQRIAQLFTPNLAVGRIQERNTVGEITADIKDRNFPAYRLHAYIQNDNIREMTACTLVHVADDSMTMARNEVITTYLAKLRDHLSLTGESIGLLTLVEQEATQETNHQLALKRRTLLRDMMIAAGIPTEKVLLRTDSQSSSSCLQKDTDGELNAWIAVIAIK